MGLDVGVDVNDIWLGVLSNLTELGDPLLGVEEGVIITISDSHDEDDASDENDELLEGHIEKEPSRDSLLGVYCTWWLANIFIIIAYAGELVGRSR